MIKDRIKELFTKRRVDLIVIASLLLLSIAAVLIFTLTRSDGAYATVSVDGVTVAEYPLSEDGVFTLGGGSNVLTVKDGCAYMTYSNCPDHTCERVGKVRHVGESIVCLPNKITVTVTGESDGAVDLVS